MLSISPFEKSHPGRRSLQFRWVATVFLLTLAACSHLGNATMADRDGKAPRAQLSIGYSTLYQEADGIPKVKWLLRFKEKSDDMARASHDLLSYYQELAATLQKLSKQYPAVRIDAVSMSEIEADERKALGEDFAKDMAPVVGKTGIDFEREALLTFYNALDEQRHLAGVMIGLETVPALKKFLETTKAQLEDHYARVGALLNRRYFTH